jgi:hypothetical protein
MWFWGELLKRVLKLLIPQQVLYTPSFRGIISISKELSYMELRFL